MTGKTNPRAYLSIVGGILVHLSLGTIFSIGNMIPYMVSYLRLHSQSTDLRNTGAVWIQSAALTGQALGIIISGVVRLKCSTRVTTVIGSCVMSSGVAVSYFAINQSFWLLLLTYGLQFGIGLGIAYTPAFSCAMRWLPEKKGFVAGLVLMGFGAGAFVFNQIQTVYINPDNYIPDLPVSPGSKEKYFTQAAVLDRVPTCFLLLAGCFAGLQILGVVLISDPPNSEGDDGKPSDTEDSVSTATHRSTRLSNRGQDNTSFIEDCLRSTNVDIANNDVKLPRNYHSIGEAMQLERFGGKYSKQSPIDTNANGVPNEVSLSTDETIQLQALGTRTYTSDTSGPKSLEQKQYSIKEMLKTRNFWILYVTFLLNGQGTILISSMYKAFGQTFIKDDHFLALVGSFSALFNSTGRPAWGFIADVFTYKIAMMFLCTSMCLLLFTFEMTALGGKVMFFVWVCAFYFSFCGNYSMLPAAVSRTFGTERMEINYSAVFSSQIVASVTGAVLASQLKDSIGWFGLFQLTGGFIFLNLLLTVMFNGKNPDGTPV